MRNRVVFAVTLGVVAMFAAAPSGGAEDVDGAPPKAGASISTKKVVKSDLEWSKQLTKTQFMVTRRKATEPAFSGKYVRNHALGTYACICCDLPLFNARAKFESGTGWPSFWSPLSADRIQTAPDFHGGEPRIEVTCVRCDAHLGHVFEDGPPPTGLRFCMNSAALKFIPDTKAKAKATAKPAPMPMPDAPPATDASDAPTPAPPQTP